MTLQFPITVKKERSDRSGVTEKSEFRVFFFNKNSMPPLKNYNKKIFLLKLSLGDFPNKIFTNCTLIGMSNPLIMKWSLLWKKISNSHETLNLEYPAFNPYFPNYKYLILLFRKPTRWFGSITRSHLISEDGIKRNRKSKFRHSRLPKFQSIWQWPVGLFLILGWRSFDYYCCHFGHIR